MKVLEWRELIIAEETENSSQKTIGVARTEHGVRINLDVWEKVDLDRDQATWFIDEIRKCLN